MRTKQLKFLERSLLALFFTLFLSSLNAQYIEVPLQKKIQNAPFIFEGEVISSQSFMPEEQKIIYTSHIIKISKILKGNFPNDEVEIITVGGNVNGLRLDVTNNLMLRDGWEGIFFCRNTVRPSLNRSNSNLALRVYEGEQGFIRYQNHFGSTTAKTVFHYYENVETELLSVIEQKTRKRERVNPNKREKALLEWISQKSYGNTSRNGMKTGIEYGFVNPEITGQNDEYFEFDIEVSTFANTFLFGNSEIYLEYDPNVWGLNMVANGKITATKETVILSSDYSLTLGDETASKLKLAINSISNPNNPFSLTPNNEELCHLKLDISNLLSVSPSIFFDETSMQGESEYYQNGNFYDFLNVVAADSMIQSWSSFLSPVIDTIYPDFITAGTFDTLYIKGEFGTTKGEVFFPDADLSFGIPPNVKADDVDVFWSDTLIKVMMFSINSNFEIPGAGFVKIKTANDSITSSTTISMKFTIHNYKDSGTGKSNLLTLTSKNNIDTFLFYLHEDIGLTSDTADVMREAIKQWRCKSGINWKLANTSTNKEFERDAVNSISFNSDPTLMDASTLWATRKYLFDTSFVFNECNYNGQKYIYVDEIDMRINGLKDWFMTTNLNQTDTTKWDFWTIALHEFGHAHLLEHILSPSDVLYPFYTKQRIDRDINFFAESGANWIMDTIEVVSPNCGGTLIRNTFGCTTSTSEIFTQNQIIKAYPNPFNNQITIEFNNLYNIKDYEISIIDINGRSLFTENGSVTNGINRIQILKDDLAKGFYFIKVRLDNKVSFIKVIKT